MIGSPLEQFELIRLVPLGIGSVDVSFTNESLMMVVSVCVLVGSSWMVMVDGGRVIPNRWQQLWEGIYKLIVGMVYESVGKSGGAYVGKVFALFGFIWMCNMVGLVPYSYTVTSQLIITLTLSIGVWVGKVCVGVKKHGIKLVGMFIPAGAPFAMVPFFGFVEILGFIIPIVSLAVRLFANMMSGHILLKVLFGFTWMMMMAGGWMMIMHVVPLGILFALMGLETAVGVVQAYVFALLTCIYIGDMESGGH